MLEKVYFIVILGFTSVRMEVTDHLIQAENMVGNVSEINHRSGASGLKSVHLYQGDYIEFELCFTSITELNIKEVVYSNDGPRDRLRIALDTTVLGDVNTSMFSDSGKGWDRFRSSGGIFSGIAVEGHHVLKLTVEQSDSYGVEIDYIRFTVNHSFVLDSLSCNAFCFDDITFPYSKPVKPLNASARAVQRSVKTQCAEEDNVNIPIFHDSASNIDFVVTASLPKYRSFLNKRGADWTNCQMYEAFWKYQDISFTHDHTRSTRTSKVNINLNGHTSGVGGTRQVSVIEVEFELEGPSTGSTDSDIGTIVHLDNIRFQGTLLFQFQYYNRYNSWSSLQLKFVKNNERNIVFETPDFSFKEGKGNRIRLEVYTDHNSSDSISVGQFFMFKRWLKSDTTNTLYKDGLTVIEGIHMDMWWRINETMSVTIKGVSNIFHDIEYIRIYRRVPWTTDGYSQVFVLYQDANIRLLPTTPHGLDWIPFGSSVIIGQTNPLSNRPSAPISHLYIDPDLLQVRILYMDGNIVSLKIQTTFSETQLHVSGNHYVRDLNLYPFFTFRSMYVADDNNDVDHLSVDGGKPVKVTEQWNELRGNYFAFYRQCISKHNTQSPDISILLMS